VPYVNTVRCDIYARLVGVDLKPIRIERLRLFAERRGLANNPSGLAEAIGKKPNQVYNLLHGTASFGEKVARSIEDSAGLPKGWLDGPEVEPTSLSTEMAQLVAAAERLTSERWRDWTVNALRQAVKLAQEAEALEALRETDAHQPRKRSNSL
jgi:hypothetical protein